MMLIHRLVKRYALFSHGVVKQQVRQLSLLEHYSHSLLQQYHIPVPKGFVVTTPEDAKSVVTDINAPSVLKSQILAGGRGKGMFNSDGKGGIRIVNSPDEAFENASKMLGYYLTTKQTPPGGLLVQKLYIYKAVDVVNELFLALTMDREQYCPMILISTDGGVNIESNVDKLHRFWFPLSTGISEEVLNNIQATVGFTPTEMHIVGDIIRQMVKLFQDKDATLLELNPLVRTPEGHFVCLDAKFDFDNSAQFRQPEIFAMEEPLPEMVEEHEASKHGLSYIKLDGNIGNIVNGAGLAMATNDLISYHGGRSANFLDIGGKANTETLRTAFEILGKDARIKGILVNIFGGIVRCDMIAKSIIEAASVLGAFKVPVVVRLRGTNSDEALKTIASSGLHLDTETDFEVAVERIVKLTNND